MAVFTDATFVARTRISEHFEAIVLSDKNDPSVTIISFCPLLRIDGVYYHLVNHEQMNRLSIKCSFLGYGCGVLPGIMSLLRSKVNISEDFKNDIDVLTLEPTNERITVCQTNNSVIRVEYASDTESTGVTVTNKSGIRILTDAEMPNEYFVITDSGEKLILQAMTT